MASYLLKTCFQQSKVGRQVADLLDLCRHVYIDLSHLSKDLSATWSPAQNLSETCFKQVSNKIDVMEFELNQTL